MITATGGWHSGQWCG